MKRLWLLLIILLAATASTYGQGGNTVTIRFAGAPTGSCSPISYAVNNATGDFYDCLAGSWNQIGAGGGGSGTVTSVSFTGGLVSVATPTTTPALTVAGTSGGIPYFSGAATWASSAALTANLPVIGGGAGATPTVGTVTGNTTQFATWTGATTASRCVHTDASGNLIIAAADCTTPGATTALDNLASVAANVAISPGTDNSVALGSATKRWSNLFATALTCGVGGTTSCKWHKVPHLPQGFNLLALRLLDFIFRTELLWLLQSAVQASRHSVDWVLLFQWNPSPQECSAGPQTLLLRLAQIQVSLVRPRQS